MAETNIYSEGVDPVVGCSGPVAGVTRSKIRAMKKQFQKCGQKEPEFAEVVKLRTIKQHRFAAE